MATEIRANDQVLPYTVRPRLRDAPSILTHGLLPALACGLLMWLGYFPMAIGWFAWVALAPLLMLVRSRLRPWQIYFSAWVAGLAFFWPVLQWMRVADFRMYYTWAMLATYCSLYFPLAVFLIRQIDLRTAVPLVLSVPCVWVGLEFLRSFLMTGFAWYFLGHTQHNVLPLIQIADITGVYGVSFLVAAVNALIFSWLYRVAGRRAVSGLKAERQDRWLGQQVIAVLVVIGGTLAYGWHRLDQEDFEAGPTLALVQGNLDQRLRNEAFATGQEGALQIHHHYIQLCGLALLKQAHLVVWPETSFPARWIEIAPEVEASKVPLWSEAVDVQEAVHRLGRQAGTNFLLGVNAVYINDEYKPVLYNSALLVNADGNWGPRHDKMHRIPFGEYVPFKDWLPFLNDLMPYDFDYSIRAGDKFTRFQVGEHRFGVLICYEDTDPFLARRYLREEKDGPAVDFLINISNDGWFDGTAEHEEHLALCRFRAVECRRALARSVNMGISAIIDPNGRVLKPNRHEEYPLEPYPAQAAEKKEKPGVMHSWQLADRGMPIEDLPMREWRDYKKIAGVLTTEIPIDRRTSYYALWGDWLPSLCWLLVGAAIVWGWLPQRATSVVYFNRRGRRESQRI